MPNFMLLAGYLVLGVGAVIVGAMCSVRLYVYASGRRPFAALAATAGFGISLAVANLAFRQVANIGFGLLGS